MSDPRIKELLGFKPDTPDAIFDEWWKKRTSSVCKPCWELKYCPYGPLVEQFPAIPMTRDEAIEDYEETIRCLESGRFTDGKPLDKATRGLFKKWVEEFNPDEWPEEMPKEMVEMGCTIYGHLCPVVKVNEPFTETKEPRRRGRSIPKATILRVVRRDNGICQVCGRALKDEEIEFDHIIPLSRGGSSEESNLRVTCKQCNRKKSDRIDG